ncbi:glucagon-like peptide 1 receptor [Nyctibius grandis]|uniref:glucagon-like peptide 1 receptor n=1 Tax=Nyctibius grandis TaxID=48427 RepID=UPI0035BC4ED0
MPKPGRSQTKRNGVEEVGDGVAKAFSRLAFFSRPVTTPAPSPPALRLGRPPPRLRRCYKSGRRGPTALAVALPSAAAELPRGAGAGALPGPRAWGAAPDMPFSPPAALLGFALVLLAAAGRSLPVRRTEGRKQAETLLLPGRCPRGDAPPGNNTLSSDGSLSGVMQKWKEYQLQCLKYFHEAPPRHGSINTRQWHDPPFHLSAEGKFRNRTFDNYACWPDGLPGTYVNVSCPWYLPWANAVPHGQAYRFCTPEGTWLLKENSTLPWRNLSECEASDQDAPEEQLLNLSIIYTIGYALSFSALVIATAILLGFR